MAYDNQALMGNSTSSVHSYVEADIYFESLIARNGIGLYLNCIGETQIVGSSGPYQWTPDGYSVMVTVNDTDTNILDFVLKYATVDTGEIQILATGQYQITDTPGGKLRLQINGTESVVVLFDGDIILGPIEISPDTIKEGFCGFHFLPYSDDFMMTVDNFVAYSAGSGDGYIEIISNIGVSSTQGIVPFTVNFTDQSSGAATSWFWDFGDGTTSSEQNPSHEFTIPGIYKVMLTVTDGFTFDTDVVTIVAVRYLIGSDAIGHWIKADTQFFAIDVVDNVINIYDSDFVKQGTITGNNGDFNNATFLFYDGTYIYVCDSGNNRIQWYTTSGQYVSGFPVAGIPFGCCTNGAYVYVTDIQNDRVMVYTMTGEFVESFGSAGSEQGQFQNPQGICVDNHFLYVMDSDNGRVQIFTLDYEIYEVNYNFKKPTTCRPDGTLLFVYDDVTNNNQAIEMRFDIPLSQEQIDPLILIHDVHGR